AGHRRPGACDPAQWRAGDWQVPPRTGAQRAGGRHTPCALGVSLLALAPAQRPAPPPRPAAAPPPLPGGPEPRSAPGAARTALAPRASALARDGPALGGAALLPPPCGPVSSPTSAAPAAEATDARGLPDTHGRAGHPAAPGLYSRGRPLD